MKHHVVADRAGWGEHKRLTCFTLGCHGATIVRQPYMTNAQWAQKVKVFTRIHPHTKPMTWEQYNRKKAKQARKRIVL